VRTMLSFVGSMLSVSESFSSLWLSSSPTRVIVAFGLLHLAYDRTFRREFTNKGWRSSVKFARS
jgi:hypothetical protein